MGTSPEGGMPRSGRGTPLKGRRAAQPSAACGRCSEAEQRQRSVFCKGAPAARSKNRAPQPGGFRSYLRTPAMASFTVNASRTVVPVPSREVISSPMSSLSHSRLHR